MSHVRTADAFAEAVRDWLDLIAEECPELFDKIMCFHSWAEALHRGLDRGSIAHSFDVD
ncbi:hypothetical protein [Pseudothauera nasutitermitis]|uniref:hypothetical protein n=1 Tax=Pseudothauera nasutitermitis TaxID=2565930 RepID=UPI001454BB05|nr:hypothetical protein [Pseudothauera nasutitermitis]